MCRDVWVIGYASLSQYFSYILVLLINGNYLCNLSKDAISVLLSKIVLLEKCYVIEIYLGLILMTINNLCQSSLFLSLCGHHLDQAWIRSIICQHLLFLFKDHLQITHKFYIFIAIYLLGCHNITIHLSIITHHFLNTLSLYNTMDFKNIFNKKEEEQESCFPKLTFTERMIAFAICVGLGYVLQILSFGSILSIATGNPAKFAIIYSLGNVLTLAATGFLIGFKRQIKNMADTDRRVTSIIFIGALLGTLLAALVFQSKILVIIFLVIQIPAYIWYCASYIPFARSCIKSCLSKCFKKAEQ